MKDVTVLVSASGAPGTAALLQGLRANGERTVRPLPDQPGNSGAVQRTPRQRLENQDVDGSLHQTERFTCHASPVPSSCEYSPCEGRIYHRIRRRDRVLVLDSRLGEPVVKPFGPDRGPIPRAT